MLLRIVPYVRGLLTVAEAATCTALARVVKRVSHDRLSRILKDQQLEWQTLLRAAALRIVGKLHGGWLIIDDTVMNKSFAKKMEGLAWVYCSKEQRSVLGLNLVVLAWSNGTVTVPLAVKIWKKNGGKSKYDLALTLLSYARNILQLQPKYVVFDSWYTSQKILKRLQYYRWTFYSQLKKNRLFNGGSVSTWRPTRYWTERGVIFGKLNVLVVKHGGKYFVTNNPNGSKADLLACYQTRWRIETMFRVLYSRLGLQHCQALSRQCQTAHVALCLMSFMILERAKMDTGLTSYQLRREFTFHPERLDSLLFQLQFTTA